MAYEQAGEKMKAAKTYEKIVSRDSVSKRVLAYRLATLYAECGVTNKALHWAEAVTKDHPDPKPYVAGIHAMLGDYENAAGILKAELNGRMVRLRPLRQMTLRWSLADVHERSGNLDQAEQELGAALAAAKGSLSEATAERRLKRFCEKHKREKTGVRRSERRGE